jgi:sugar/nucleoside kinase (ribokinase family)
MQGPPRRQPEPDETAGSGRAVDVVVVGHAGWSTVRTRGDSDTSAGGSGFAVAASAAELIGGRVGLVAQVCSDVDLTALRCVGVNMDGVVELPGRSAQLYIDELDDGTRSFSSDLGVAAVVRLDTFPSSYMRAAFIHLGTAPPDQQLTWLECLRSRGCRAQISADMFEHYVTKSPDASREVCDNVDLIFMNEAEYKGLYGSQRPAPKPPLVLKRGPRGASIITDGLADPASAPSVRMVDPTGGGEVLAGVFLALRADGLSASAALRFAVRAAASCVEDFGVRGPHLLATLASIREESQPRPSA